MKPNATCFSLNLLTMANTVQLKSIEFIYSCVFGEGNREVVALCPLTTANKYSFYERNPFSNLR